MTLGNLLYDIRDMYKKSESSLSEYRYIAEVESFLTRRFDDLKEFERLVGGYNLSDSVINVHLRLKERGVPVKFYGICMKGAGYFEIPKKIEKRIMEEQEELLAMYYAEKQAEEKDLNTEGGFDKYYAIPDELTSEELEEKFGD